MLSRELVKEVDLQRTHHFWASEVHPPIMSIELAPVVGICVRFGRESLDNKHNER